MAQFHVGQKVVAIADHSQNLFKKGEEFIVTAIRQGCKCSPIYISVNLHLDATHTKCYQCGNFISGQWFNPEKFVPALDQFQAVTYTKTLETELVSAN